MKNILLIGGAVNDYSLEASYKRAFEKEGFGVNWFDTQAGINKYVKLNKLGSIFNQFVPIEPWNKKMSKDVVFAANTYKPLLIILFCNTRISVGAIAYIKSVLSCKIILLWPDPLTNIDRHVLDYANLLDGVVSYSKNEIRIFEKLGFENVKWLPFAADEAIHRVDSLPIKNDNELCFIGGYRPERECVLSEIKKHFSNLKIEIYGTDWNRTKSRELKKSVINKALRGAEFAEKLNRSMISLNIMDMANFPAANMRFFEISISSGLQLASSCPEFTDEFIEKQHLFYYNNSEHLFEQIEYILYNKNTLKQIRNDAFNHVLEKHTYKHRTKTIIEEFL